MKYSPFSQTKLGSNDLLRAHGRVGQAHPCAQNNFLLPLFFTKNKFCSIIMVVLISLAILQYNSTTINKMCQSKNIHYQIT